jgi:hypothetical protein
VLHAQVQHCICYPPRHTTQSHCLLYAAAHLLGLLQSLPAILQPFAQPQHAADDRALQLLARSVGQYKFMMKATPAKRAFGLVSALFGMWDTGMPSAPPWLPPVLDVALPVLQQLQRVEEQLTMSSVGASSSTDSSALHWAFGEAQISMGDFLCTAHAVASTATGAAFSNQVQRLLLDPATAGMMLQQLAATIMVLHQQHSAQDQQEQLQQVVLEHGAMQQHRCSGASSPEIGSSSSSSSSSSSNSSVDQAAPAQTGVGRQQRLLHHGPKADLSAIPAFHQGMVHVLPGLRALCDAATNVTRRSEASRVHNWGTQMMSARGAARSALILADNLASRRMAGCQQLNSSSVVLSTAAVQMLLELQLLAAGLVQRLRQQVQRGQQQQDLGLSTRLQSAALLKHSAYLLREVIHAVAACRMPAGSSSGLPPELLQQHGLLLLQALSAPLEQLQLSSADAAAELQTGGAAAVTAGAQMCALRAALSGLEALPEGESPLHIHFVAAVRKTACTYDVCVIVLCCVALSCQGQQHRLQSVNVRFVSEHSK